MREEIYIAIMVVCLVILIIGSLGIRKMLRNYNGRVMDRTARIQMLLLFVVAGDALFSISIITFYQLMSYL